MKIYRIVYRRGPQAWWDFRGSNSNGIYTELSTARSIATKLTKGRYGYSEAVILEAETEWATVEFKERNV